MIAKRQGIMQKLLEFIMGNLTPNSNEYQVDGALHMIAVISAQLIKSKVRITMYRISDKIKKKKIFRSTKKMSKCSLMHISHPAYYMRFSGYKPYLFQIKFSRVLYACVHVILYDTCLMHRSKIQKSLNV